MRDASVSEGGGGVGLSGHCSGCSAVLIANK